MIVFFVCIFLVKIKKKIKTSLMRDLVLVGSSSSSGSPNGRKKNVTKIIFKTPMIAERYPLKERKKKNNDVKDDENGKTKKEKKNETKDP